MAKKQKRQVTFTSPSSENTGRTIAAVVRPSSEFNPDYTYIKKDLQSMGILVAGFVGVLVILSFFLR
ncbi:MAG: hypothetical protein WCG34_08340 [Leptolinea sp.]